MGYLIERILDVNQAVHVFRERTKNLEFWIESSGESEFKTHLNEVSERALSHRKKEVFIQDLSTSPIFFYRVFNGKYFWDIREEKFSSFVKSGPIKIWQENSMYPKPGDVRRWLEKIT